MISSTAFYFIVVGFFLYFILYILKQKSRRKAACFKMYAVRDGLILLIAQEKLTKQSKVFQYYYSRVNSLLSKAPNIGIDDVAKTMLHMKNDDLDKALEKARKEANKIFSSKDMEIQEVRDVVESYYSASGSMIFSHSSIMRLVYFTHIRSGFFSHYIKQVLPKKILNRFRIIKFTENEMNLIRNHN